MYRLLRYSLASKTYLPTSRHILFYTSSAIKDKIPVSAAKDTDQVSENLDNFLENCVYKAKRPAFKLLRQTEKKSFNLANEVKVRNLENETSEKIRNLEIEIAKKDKEIAVTAVKTVSCA